MLVLLLVVAPAFAGTRECDAAVRANQVGFDVSGAKRAIVVSSATEPLRWRLVDEKGEVHADGDTAVFGEDPPSGEHLHLVDFTAYRAEGDALRIESDCAVSHPFVVSGDPFAALKYDALAYFYHNRSGIPILARFAGKRWTRPAGHPQDTASCRRGKDRHGNRWPGCDYRLDLTGGWYDAGDHGKYVVNGGITVWTLLNLFERQLARGIDSPFRDGSVAIPEAGNGVNDLLDEARFELEFLLRMQAPAGAVARVPVGAREAGPDLEFRRIDASGMAHHNVADEEWTPLPTPPHLDREKRVLAPVSTAATLNLAAVAAQCARIWRGLDAAFSARCLLAAETAYAAAKRNPEVYFVADFEGSGPYNDGNVDDEFFWAAAELSVTTGAAAYLGDVRASRHFTAALSREPAWPRVAGLGVVSLALLPSALPERERERLRQTIIAAARSISAERRRSGYHIPYATTRYPWGSNSTLLNRAILLALAFDFSGEAAFRGAVTDVLDYVLGRNPLDRSYVTGYGDRPLQNPYHRFWAHSVDAALPPPPPGALSGGPNSNFSADRIARELIRLGCPPQACWLDDARSWSMNEVAINWNAPLVWVSAFLDERPP